MLKPLLILLAITFSCQTILAQEEALPDFSHGPSAVVHLVDYGFENGKMIGGELGYYAEKRLIRQISLQSGLYLYYISGTFESGDELIFFGSNEYIFYNGPITHKNFALQIPFQLNYYIHKRWPICVSLGIDFGLVLSASNDWTYDEFIGDNAFLINATMVTPGATNQMLSIEQEPYYIDGMFAIGYQLKKIKIEALFRSGDRKYDVGAYGGPGLVSFALGIHYKL